MLHSKLKEMVLATLTESDVTVPDDVVEAIVDRVALQFFYFFPNTLSQFFFLIGYFLLGLIFSDNDGG